MPNDTVRFIPEAATTEPLTPRDIIFAAIDAELRRAYAKHGREPWGRHEFYGVIAEEFSEMWDAIRADAHDTDFLAEVVEVAAMCVRYLESGDRNRGDLLGALWVVRRVKERRADDAEKGVTSNRAEGGNDGAQA